MMLPVDSTSATVFAPFGVGCLKVLMLPVRQTIHVALRQNLLSKKAHNVSRFFGHAPGGLARPRKGCAYHLSS
nr:MAG TPA: hypothetical protein [Caudoviricetes sp.]